MLTFPLAVVFLAFNALASPVLQKRDGASIVAALTKVEGDIVTLNTSLNTFAGGLIGTFQALQIQGESQTLLNDLNSATTAATSSAALSDSDSAAVAFAISTLTTDNYQVLNNLVSKKTAFQTAILGVASATSLVESDLKSLKNATDNFGAAIVAKLDSQLASLAPLVISNIDFHFFNAIAAYSS